MKTRFIRTGNLEVGDTVINGGFIYNGEQVFSVYRTVGGELKVEFESGGVMWVMPNADVEIVDERL